MAQVTRSRRAKLGAALAIQVIIALATANLVFAGTQGSDCVGDTSKVRLWENAVGDTSDGNDSVWLCGNTSNLIFINHTLAGTCKGAFVGQSTWNDCVQRATIWVPAGWRLVFYRDDQYNTWDLCVPTAGGIAGGAVNMNTTDALTSFRWLQGTTCP